MNRRRLVVSVVILCLLVFVATVIVSLMVPLADAEPGLINWFAQ